MPNTHTANIYKYLFTVVSLGATSLLLPPVKLLSCYIQNAIEVFIYLILVFLPRYHPVKYNLFSSLLACLGIQDTFKYHIVVLKATI